MNKFREGLPKHNDRELPTFENLVDLYVHLKRAQSEKRPNRKFTKLINDQIEDIRKHFSREQDAEAESIAERRFSK